MRCITRIQQRKRQTWLDLPDSDLQEADHGCRTERLISQDCGAPSMCRTQLAFMSRFYRFAKRGLLIDIHNPVSDIALPKPDKSSVKVIRANDLSDCWRSCLQPCDW